MPVQRADDLGDVVVVDFFLEQLRVALLLGECSSPRLCELLSRCGSTPYCSSAAAFEVRLRARACSISIVRLLDLLRSLLKLPGSPPLLGPSCACSASRFFLQRRQLASRASRGAPCDASSFSLRSASRSISSCMMRRSISSSSDGMRVDLDAQLRRGLVDQVDRLVRQEAVGDIAVRQHRRRDERRVLDAHAVMDFVALLRPRRIAIVSSTVGSPTSTGWKRRSSAASFSMCLRYSSRVVAPIAAQLAARQHRLQHVRGVHRAFGRARADEGVQLVDEQDDLSVGLLDFFQDRLQPLLEFAAELRAGDQRAQVERDHPLVLQPLRHVAAHDPLRQPFDDRRLADARLADQTGLFFVRRESTWITRRISSSRPITGSSLPWRASSVRSRPYFSSDCVSRLRDSATSRAARPRIPFSNPRMRSRDDSALGQQPGRLALRSQTPEQQVLGADALITNWLASCWAVSRTLRVALADDPFASELYWSDGK